MLSESNPYSYVKSPSGIFTEATLPVGEITAGEHYADTINSARISFRRFNNATQNKYNLNIPATLLMVRKGQEFKFFDDEKLPDNTKAISPPTAASTMPISSATSASSSLS